MRLNPFFIRASVRTARHRKYVVDQSLNPFFIRASVRTARSSFLHLTIFLRVGSPIFVALDILTFAAQRILHPEIKLQ
jgi:hypothetical protein